MSAARRAAASAEPGRPRADTSHAMYRPSGDLVRLKQPRGVRRTYYRGNDERSEKLFNGGFYRTATIDLTLVDATGAEIDIGDTCAEGPLSLRFEIRSAAKAAPELFTDAIAKGTTFSTATAGQKIDPRQPRVPLE